MYKGTKEKPHFSPKTSIQIKIADFNQYFFILKITTFPGHGNYNSPRRIQSHGRGSGCA